MFEKNIDYFCLRMKKTQSIRTMANSNKRERKTFIPDWPNKRKPQGYSQKEGAQEFRSLQLCLLILMTGFLCHWPAMTIRGM